MTSFKMSLKRLRFNFQMQLCPHSPEILTIFTNYFHEMFDFHFFFFPPFEGLAYFAASWSKKASDSAARLAYKNVTVLTLVNLTPDFTNLL